MSKQTDSLVAFLIGAALGGVAALLLAPDKGAETRKKLRRGLQDLYDRGEGAVEGVTEQVGETVGDATEGARRHFSALREAATEARAAYDRELRRDA